jgi:transketolase
MITDSQIKEAARQIRAQVLRMSNHAKTAHLASALSCVDILAASYFGVLSIDPKQPSDPARDRFILSKGQAVSALYATLAQAGFFETDLLRTYNDDGSCLPEQPSPGCAPGVELATGSLGHGLPVGLGMALAGRYHHLPYRVIVLMSDGECNEGSVWEAAMTAPALKLTSVTVVIDYNRWQATARSNETLALSPLQDKWRAFGWHAVEVDGHDVGQIQGALRLSGESVGKPIAVLAHTVKGKGVSFMEDDNNWHYRSPTDTELQMALEELGLA